MPEQPTDHAMLLEAIAALFHDGAAPPPGREATLTPYLQQIAATFPQQTSLHPFHQTLDLLAYHGQSAALADLLTWAWPHLSQSPLLNPAGVQALAQQASDSLVLHFVATHPAGTPANEQLLAALQPFFPVDNAQLDAYLALLSGRVGRPWSLAHFTPLTAANLAGLMVEFLGYVQAHALAPLTRADLLRQQLPRYLLARQAGELNPRQDVAELLRQGRIPGREPPRPEHPLTPDPATLAIFLDRLTQIIHPRPYAAAAFVDLMPAWFHFLASRQLIEASQASRLASALHPMLTSSNLPPPQ